MVDNDKLDQINHTTNRRSEFVTAGHVHPKTENHSAMLNNIDILSTIPTIKGKSWWLSLSHKVRGIVIVDCKMFYHQKNESKQYYVLLSNLILIVFPFYIIASN